MDRAEIYTSYMYSYPHKTAYGTIAADAGMLMDQLAGEGPNLYIHIPFCETKCGYCNLFSVTGKPDTYIGQYLKAIREQAEQYGLRYRRIPWQSFTVGGGTPLLLSERQLEDLMQLAAEVGALESYSGIETSPNQTTREKVEILKANRINRVSIGVQSFLDQELAMLGRRHKAESAKKALSLLKATGFDCLNVDLIYGIRYQTMASLQYSLDQTMAYDPEELFVYPLYIRKGTGLYSDASVPHERTYEFYWFIRDYLLKQGYHQVSMRRFTRQAAEPGTGCGFESTLSLGCGGRSYLGNIHCCTPYSVKKADCLKSLDEFIEKRDKSRIDFGYCLNEEEQKRRYVIKNLLHTDGICRYRYRQLFGHDAEADFPVFTSLYDKQYCSGEEGRIRLTPLGMSLSDYIGPKFISPEVREKMEQWWQR